MIELPRRKFITGLASLIAAPAIVRASSLMPVKLFKPSMNVMNVMTNYNLNDDVIITQVDVLYGWLNIDPKWTINLDKVL